MPWMSGQPVFSAWERAISAAFMQMLHAVDGPRLPSRTAPTWDAVTMRIINTTVILFLIALLPAGAFGQTPPTAPQAPQQNAPANPSTFQDTVQVTATRFGEPVAE